MAEWLKAAVLKIASRAIVTGVRIPLPPPFPFNESYRLSPHNFLYEFRWIESLFFLYDEPSVKALPVLTIEQKVVECL